MDLQYSKFIPVGIKWGNYNIRLCSCYHSVRQWYRFHRHGYSSRAILYIGGLVVSHATVSGVVVDYMVTYLTTKAVDIGLAAALTNAHDGLSAMLVIVLAHISDAFMGHFKMIVFTNIAYFLGLVLLSGSAMFMSEDNTVRVFYGAVVLVSLGEAGRSASLKAFLEDQCISERKDKPYISHGEKSQKTCTAEALWSQWLFLGAVLGPVLWYLPWALIFVISAVAIGVSSYIFWLGRASYFINNKDPTSNKEAIRTLRLDYVENLSTLCPVEQLQGPRRDSRELYTVIELIPSPRAEQAQGGTYFTDREEWLRPAERVTADNFWTFRKLKEEKLFFMKLLPLCPTFLVYSVVDASVKTFYTEQAYNWNGPGAGIILIMYSKSFSNFIVPYLFRLLVPKKYRVDKVMQIGSGLSCCALCCIAAWQVEIHRMSSVKDDEPNYSNLSIFWLLPQFCLAGFMKGLAVEGLQDLILDQVAEDNKLLTRYGPHISDFVLGIGNFITVLILLACRQSWFQGETRRLDEYYRFLTNLSLANLICYLLLCQWRRLITNDGDGSQSKIVDDEGAGGGTK